MFSPTIVALAFLIFLLGITIGLFWDKRSLAWFLYLFGSELRIFAFFCYGLGVILAVFGLGFGLLLGGIFGVMIVDLTVPDAFGRIRDVAIITMFVAEFFVLFLFGRFCDRKLFTLPQE